MSKENKPLLSDEHLIATDDRVRRATLSNLDGLKMVRDHYEANITKDRELIQTLTNSIGKFLDMANDGDVVVYHLEDDQPPPTEQLESALALAGEQGYQPTEK